MGKERSLSKSFDLATAATVVLVGFVAQVVFQFIFSLFPLSKDVYTWIVVIANQVIFFTVALIYSRTRKVDLLAVTGAKEPPKWYYFPIFILIAVCCVTCFAPLSGLFTRLLRKLGYDHTPQYFIPKDNAGLFTLAFLALTLLPVIGEEVMLRGVLMSGAKNRAPIMGILYTALIFALLHGNLHQIIHQFLLGVIMGYLAYLTGGIYASAVVHMTNNAIAMLLDYGYGHKFVNQSFYYYVAGELGAEPTFIGMAISFFALVMLLVLFTCLLHRDRSKNKEYIPSEGSLSDKINDYLLFLSTPTLEREKEAKDALWNKKLMDGLTLLLTVTLTCLLSLILIATMIPGVK